MKEVLFVCTGNYYRSRFAEIVFNHIAAQKLTSAKAFSRGLRLNPEKNKGVISPHVTAYLGKLNISPRETGFATKLELQDLERADFVVILDEKEHRPMLQASFPDWEPRVTYWNFEDDYITSPEEVLPNLNNKVEKLLTLIQEGN
jgi:protein-tyrosine phosphatase